MSAAVAHPLIGSVPQLAPAVTRALRWAVLAQLRARWAGGRLDLVLPRGDIARIGGAGPADATARVHDDRLFVRMLLRGELGVGEAFVAGEWSSDDLTAVTRVFLRGTVARGVESPVTWLGQLRTRLRHRRAANTQSGSARNVHAHYDLGNEFYALFLDPETLAYSCALFDRPDLTLAAAQRAKFDRLCDQLALGPDDHLLELGCGWGGMAIHAATTRGCRVTAVTISRAQHAAASARIAAAGLADRIRVVCRDYRDLDGTFDKIVSIEMLEAIGFEFLPAFFATCGRALRPGGLLAVQSITMPDDRFERYRHHVDWMQTYIFPGSCIPSLRAIRDAAATAGFEVASAYDLGPHYPRTLRAWRDRFSAALPAVHALGFDPPFIRAWWLYLAFSEAVFAERTLADHQLLLTRRS